MPLKVTNKTGQRPKGVISRPLALDQIVLICPPDGDEVRIAFDVDDPLELADTLERAAVWLRAHKDEAIDLDIE